MYEIKNGKIYRTSREEVTNEEIVKLLNGKLRLEPKNIGKPSNPEIQIGDKNASGTLPQAWEYEGNWYYNWPGAMEEAKFLGKRIPTDDEWTELLEGKNIVEFTEENNFKPSGYRNTDSNYYLRTYNSYLWSSTQVGASSAWKRGLNYSVPSVFLGSNTKAFGFSLRCVQG